MGNKVCEENVGCVPEEIVGVVDWLGRCGAERGLFSAAVLLTGFVRVCCPEPFCCPELRHGGTAPNTGVTGFPDFQKDVAASLLVMNFPSGEFVRMLDWAPGLGETQVLTLTETGAMGAWFFGDADDC